MSSLINGRYYNQDFSIWNIIPCIFAPVWYGQQTSYRHWFYWLWLMPVSNLTTFLLNLCQFQPAPQVCFVPLVTTIPTLACPRFVRHTPCTVDCTLRPVSHKNGVSHICFTPVNNFPLSDPTSVCYNWLHSPLYSETVGKEAGLNPFTVPSNSPKLRVCNLSHKSVCRLSLSLLMFFCSKCSSLQKAAYFYCQKFLSDPSLKTQKQPNATLIGLFPVLSERD